MFEHKHIREQMMAIAIIMMFVMSAFVVSVESNDATMGDDEFVIYMTTDDSFTYSPTANLTNTTFTFSGTVVGAGGASFGDTAVTKNGGTNTAFTFSPTTAGDYTAKIKAEHKITGQSAEQTITFHVKDPITFTGVQSYAFDENIAAGTALGSYKVSGMTLNEGEFTPEYFKKETNGNYVEIDMVTSTCPFIMDGTALKMNTEQEAIVPGDYKITLTATKTLGGQTGENTCSKTGSYVILASIAEGMDFTQDVVDGMVGYVDGQDKTFTFTVTNYNTISDLTATLSDVESKTIKDNTKAQKLMGIDVENEATTKQLDFNSTTGKISLPVDLSTYENTDLTNNESDRIVFNITMAGTQSYGTGDNITTVPVSVKKAFEFTMYRALEFTTKPIAGNINSYQSSVNAMNLLLTFEAQGAKKITYNWGDGSVMTKDVSGSRTTFYSSSHTYAQPGSYMITVTASNDKGDSSLFTIFNAKTGIEFDPSKVKINIDGFDDKYNGESKTLEVSPLYTVENMQGAFTPVWTWSYKPADADAFIDIPASQVEDDGTLTFEDPQTGTTFKVVMTVDLGGTTVTGEGTFVYDSNDFFTEHGWLFILFIILGLVVLILSYLDILPYIPAPWNFVLGFVILAISIPLYMYADFGGIFDALKELF